MKSHRNVHNQQAWEDHNDLPIYSDHLSLTRRLFAGMQVFGLPSIRRDIKPPEKPSVANTLSYGNGATMDQLMRPRLPCTAAQEFERLRDAHDMRC